MSAYAHESDTPGTVWVAWNVPWDDTEPIHKGFLMHHAQQFLDKWQAGLFLPDDPEVVSCTYDRGLGRWKTTLKVERR